MHTITIIADPFSSLPLPLGEKIIVSPRASGDMWEIAADVDKNSAAHIARALIDPVDRFYDDHSSEILAFWINNLIKMRGQEWSWPDLAKFATMKPREIERFFEDQFPGGEYFRPHKPVLQSLPYSLASLNRLAKSWTPGGARRLFSFEHHFRSRNKVPVVLRGAPSEWIKAAAAACALAIRETKGITPISIDLAFAEMPALYRVPEIEMLTFTNRTLGVRFGGIGPSGEFQETRRAA